MTKERVATETAGNGLVGKEFIDQVRPIADIQLVLFGNSRTVICDQNYAPLSTIHSELNKALENSTAPSFTAGIELYLPYLAQAPYSVIFVDNTASDEIAAIYPKLLQSGRIHIATPNKRAFSSELTLYRELVAAAKLSGALVYHESTVGAGLPVLSTLHDLLATGDTILKIEGIFSGTLSYIFNEWSPVPSGGTSLPDFSAVVKVAKDKGYTEPDPREDLNGLDVARKLTILSRKVSIAVDHPLAFPVESLIPKELEGVSSSAEFMDKLSRYDSQMDARRKQAVSKGQVIRFVGSIDVPSQQVKVGLESFDTTHPFAALKGSDNVIAFHTARYSSSPLIIQGAGYGPSL